MPASPVKPHGMRTEPPPSVPSASGVMPAATQAAAPALEPPGVLAVFHGLRVMPSSGLSPTALQPNSLVVVLPIRIADRDHVLHRDRHAVQSPERIAAHHGRLGVARRCHRALGQKQAERVERRLRRLGFFQRPARHLDRRQLAPRDLVAQRHCRHGVEFGGLHRNGRKRD
jgi:hypothetical protein